MKQKNPVTVERWELQSSLGKHRAIAQCLRFAFAAAVVLLLACLAAAPPVLAQSSASDWFNNGLAKGKKGDLDGAIVDFSRAIEIDPKYANAYFNRGVAKGKKGDLDGAIADYSRSIELDPKYANAHFSRGNAKGKKGDLDGAFTDYSRAIELDPKYAMAYNNRGNAKGKQGDLDGAIADYSRAIELDPKHAYYYSNRGNAFQAKGMFDQAVADFNNTIELNTKDEYACVHLVVATWLSKGDAGGAIATLRKHIDAHNSYEWVRTISKYYLGIDNLNEQAVLTEARRGKDGKEVGERLCEAYYYLGIKRLVAGNRKGAAEYFTLSIETDVKSFSEHASSKAMLALMKEGRI